MRITVKRNERGTWDVLSNGIILEGGFFTLTYANKAAAEYRAMAVANNG